MPQSTREYVRHIDKMRRVVLRKDIGDRIELLRWITSHIYEEGFELTWVTNHADPIVKAHLSFRAKF